MNVLDDTEIVKVGRHQPLGTHRLYSTLVFYKSLYNSI